MSKLSFSLHFNKFLVSSACESALYLTDKFIQLDLF